MPDFRLELAVPKVLPQDRSITTFYWSPKSRGSFASTLGPSLASIGPVLPSNIDFVRIAVTAFAADRTSPRRNGGSNWNSRNIGLTIPVHSPDLWGSVRDSLEALLGLLTGDSWRLRFLPTYGPKESIREFRTGAERVVLVSGGADSAIGALNSRQTIGRGGHILVSHIGATVLAPTQRRIGDAAKRLIPGSPQTHMQISFRRRSRQINGEPFPNEPSSRSRSLLFLAFGLVIASLEKIPLWIPENGFASLNPPLGAERRGSLSTRTTHPAFLEGLTSILDVVGAQSTIVNPFDHRTKGEMFASVSDQFGGAEASKFLSSTHSCGLTGQRSFGVSVRTQCGVCFGCVLRKAAFNSSGVPDTTEYIDANAGIRIGTWLQRNSIDSSVRAFLQRGISTHDIVTMGLPQSYSPTKALDLCRRGLAELQDLYQ